MNEQIISNTGPLIALAIIDQLDILIFVIRWHISPHSHAVYV